MQGLVHLNQGKNCMQRSDIEDIDYLKINSRHHQTMLEKCSKESFYSLLKKAKLKRKISDGKNKIPHIFFGRKI